MVIGEISTILFSEEIARRENVTILKNAFAENAV
jgi:hypothetical protein